MMPRISIFALVAGTALGSAISVPAAVHSCGAPVQTNATQPVPNAAKAKPHAPPLAAAIDELLQRAKLPAADIEKVTALRDQIRKLVTAGKEEAARDVGNFPACCARAANGQAAAPPSSVPLVHLD
jgi:hypothetical protein